MEFTLPVRVQDEVVGAAENWRERLAAWAIPPEILAGVEESPWVLPVEHFVRRARRYAADPVGASYVRAAEALGTPGSVLDVGAGAGAASLPLLTTGRVTALTAVDTSAELLDTLPDGTATILGRWPDVAARVPYADLVVCHHVFYNVPDLADFALALTGHARRRVVVELTERHPLTVLNPTRRRLCLPLDRTPEVADALREHPSVPLARVTLWWDV